MLALHATLVLLDLAQELLDLLILVLRLLTGILVLVHDHGWIWLEELLGLILVIL